MTRWQYFFCYIVDNVYVLASAFFDDQSIVPVKLEVKEFSDKKNTLYVAIALESIKKDGVSEQEVAKGVAQQYSHPSTISIRDLLKNVNPNDKDFYKYIPKQFCEKGSRTIKFSLKDSDGNELYNSSEIRYSFKGKRTASYINKRLDTPTLNFIRNELRKIYGPIDSAIADGIAIEKDNTIYVVDSGIEDGKIDFGVLYYIEIADDNLRYKNMEEINDRAVSKGHVDNEIS